MAVSSPTTPTPTRPRLSEDWAAVLIGVAVLIAVVAGFRPAIPPLKWDSLKSLSWLVAPAHLINWTILGILSLVFTLVGIFRQEVRLRAFVAGFPIVFALAIAAQMLAGSATASAWGIEYVIFALLLGLLLANLGLVPDWLREAARSEFYVKTGLVIMGATLLFQEIMQAGVLGIIQSVLVVSVVWYVTFRIVRRFHLDDEWAVMLSTAVSICGVSAAIAACGAIQGDRRKLGYVTSTVLIVAVPMIVLQPWVARWLQLSEPVAGAWIGGTLDTTGSVVAASALLGETAMKIGTVVKFSQNVLIGVAAFLLSVWWAMRPQAGAARADRPTVGVIWERFPKFVLGFLAASLVFSFFMDKDLVRETKSTIGSLRTVWFAMGFVSIGLETRFGQLLGMEGGRPFFAFLGGQVFNIFWTLLLAWLVFGGALLS
jgi:uncharacterized integral membrane protein (TIGR00698 family)